MATGQDHGRLLKIVLVGNSAVGKSQLLSRLVGGEFNAQHVPTIGDEHKNHIIEYKKKRVELHIQALSSAFWAHSDAHDAHGIIVAYDTTTPKSFTAVATYLSDIDKYARGTPEKMLLGMKKDMRLYHEVPTSKALEVAKANSMTFLEASAKTGENVELAFQTLAEEVIESMDANASPQRVAAMVQEYSLAFGKAVAGLLRLICEDLLQSFCQCVFLCKVWHQVSLSTKIFTLASVCAGVSTSMAGPVAECMKIRKIMKKRKKVRGGSEVELRFTDQENDAVTTAPLLPKSESRGSIASRSDVQDGSASAGAVPTPKAAEGRQALSSAVAPAAPSAAVKAVGARQALVSDLSIPDFVRGRATEGTLGDHGRLAYRLLLCGSVMFWVSMGLFPVIFDSKLSCGGDIPAGGHLLFFAATTFNIFIEFWILIHGYTGYTAFTNYHTKLIMGTALSFLGRFDTYSDVASCAMIFRCEAITWWSVRGVYFYLPWGIQLAQISLFTLVLGVFGSQALPGIVLLAQRKALPIAFKLNEYNALLAVMEEDLPSYEDES